MPTTYTEAQRNLSNIIAQLRTMHSSGVDVTEAYKAIEALKEKDDEQQRVNKTLQGVAETALLGAPATLFVLAYRKEGLTRTAYGFVRKNGHVTLELGHGWPISTSAESMLELQERMARAGIPCHVAYAEKPGNPTPATEAEKPTTTSEKTVPAREFWDQFIGIRAG